MVPCMEGVAPAGFVPGAAGCPPIPLIICVAALRPLSIRPVTGLVLGELFAANVPPAARPFAAASAWMRARTRAAIASSLAAVETF